MRTSLPSGPRAGLPRSRVRRVLSAIRQPLPLATYAILSRISVVLLGVIVVTGAAVRLTKSGLGCPTWPQCGAGSFVTRPEFALHGVVEFGNRMVTVFVGLVVALVVLGAFRLRERRTDLRLLSLGLVLGFIAQGVLGGLTVIFHLHPALVAGHFLVSMWLLWNAAVLDTRARHGAGKRVSIVRRELVMLADVLAVVAAGVLVVGTVVTGSGPHSGAPGDVQRFDINIRSAAQLHADAAMLLTGLVLAMALAVRLVPGAQRAKPLANALAITVVAQAAVGFIQYFAGIPTGLVAVHIAGATVLWVLSLYLRLSLSAGPALEVAEPRRPSDQLVDGDGEEEQREIGDREVEQPHRPRIAAGGGAS